MPRMMHRAGGKPSAIFIATPTYTDLSAGYAYALAHTTALLEKKGIAFELALYTGDCHVDDARNRLVRDFLESSCTDLVFIDSDLRWNAEDFVRLISHECDVVGATYPLKQDEEKFPTLLIDGEEVGESGLLKVEAVPTGFLKISRDALEILAAKSESFKPKSDHRSNIPLIFERQVHNGVRWGGDYVFCRKWGEIGDIYLDTNAWFEHYGESIWKGRYITHRKKGQGETLPGLDDIKAGKETESTISELLDEWGNTMFAASSDLLTTLMLLARNVDGDILELGSGLSTLILASATSHKVYCVEHNPIWRDKLKAVIESKQINNIEIIESEISEGWYSADIPNETSMVFCDGPPRDIGDRSQLFTRVDTNAKVLVMDDVAGPLTGRKSYVLGRDRKFVVAA